MRIGVSDDQIEDHRIEQLQHINSRPGCDPAEKREAILERRAALACVFGLCRHAERLTEVLLMNPADQAIFAAEAVIALNEQKGSVPHNPRLHRGHVETDDSGKAHHQGLVLGRTGEPGNRRLEDVCRRLAGRWQGHRAVDQNHRHFGLCAGEGQSQPLLAGEQGPDGQRVKHANEARFVERDRALIWIGRGGLFAGRQKLKRARHIPAKTIEKREIIAA